MSSDTRIVAWTTAALILVVVVAPSWLLAAELPAPSPESTTDEGPDVRRYKDENGFDVTVSGRMVTIIPPQNVVEAPGPGRESRESLLAQGFVFIDRSTEESLRKIASGRYELRYLQENGEFRTVEVELGSLNDPKVTAFVESAEDGVYRYGYRVRNRSGQTIMIMSLLVPGTEAILNFSGADGWVGSLTPHRSRMSWLPLGGTPSLAAGQEVRGLAVTSKYLPGLAEFRFLGIPARPDPPLEEFNDHLARAWSSVDAEEGESRRLTIGPAIEPPGNDVDSRSRVLSSLQSDVDKALQAGLVSPAGAEELREILSEARSRVSSRPAFEGLSERVGRIGGVDDEYRHAITIVLGVLGAR